MTTRTLASWLEIPEDSEFTLHNLPYGIFEAEGRPPRAGVAVGEWILDLAALAEAGLLQVDAEVFRQPRLNSFIRLGRNTTGRVRRRLQELLQTACPELRDSPQLRSRALVRREAARMHLPVEVGDYVDFYSSLHHAFNVGTMFRGPENALQPNWKHLPVGYHGRTSTIVVSGVEVRRPAGQTRPDPESPPVFGPSRALDFELEVAFVVGSDTPMGTRIPADRAEEHIFGLLLFNDWSARDIQKWEYVPLGPFLGKSFASSLSPWVVPLEALEPFRVQGPQQDVPVLPYLQTSGAHHFDVHLEVYLQSERMEEPVRLCRSNLRHLYWSMAQQLAHLTSNGTALRVGDLCATGTISGPEKDSRGSMLELAWKGTEPVALPDGTTRIWIEDGDTVIFRGWAEKEGIRVGFGEVRTRVLPAE